MTNSIRFQQKNCRVSFVRVNLQMVALIDDLQNTFQAGMRNIHAASIGTLHSTRNHNFIINRARGLSTIAEQPQLDSRQPFNSSCNP